MNEVTVSQTLKDYDHKNIIMMYIYNNIFLVAHNEIILK